MSRTVPTGLALLLASAFALTACSGGAGPEPKKTSTAAATATESASEDALDNDEPATIRGLATKFDKEQETQFPETDVKDVALTEDRLITAGATEMIVRTAPDLKDLYTVTSPNENQYVDVYVTDDEKTGYVLSQRQVPGAGTKLGKEYYAVQRFDVETGDVSSNVEFEMKQSSSGTGSFRIGFISAVLDDNVLVGVSGGDALPSTTLNFEMEKKKVTWRRNNAAPLGIAGDLALVTNGTNVKPGDIMGVDVASGKQRWAATTGAKTASLLGRSGPNALVAVTDAYYNASIVLPMNLRTGKSPVKSDQPIQSTTLQCRESAATAVVCASPDNTVIAWDTKANKRLWSLPTTARRAPLVTNVANGLIYGFLDETSVVLDAKTGKDLVTNSGVAPTDVNADGGVYTYMGVAFYAPVYGSEAASKPSTSATTAPTSSAPTESQSTEPSDSESALFPTDQESE